MTSEREMSRIVTFRVGADLFAADIARVERVLKYETPRSVPSMPAWLEGVIDYGGKVVPVIDLRRRFAIPHPAVNAQTRMLVVTANGEWTAAVVDAVLDVRNLEEADLSPPPQIFRGLSGDFVRGMTRRGSELVVVLDVDHLLGSQEPLMLEPSAGGNADRA
jgi:purine-binding chemotaxis protein CheW